MLLGKPGIKADRWIVHFVNRANGRTWARDVLVGPGESMDIKTFCVEAGRWEACQSIHRRLARRAPVNVRAELA
ncbi:ARPP-1 family domain-containing protein [Arthrobacter gengyunqii]|uniref:ARPP-1 family domain-containing protein n=1 Tax=Arthrobacter gengyunqii TaxID=2886940 RepID=UPI00311AB23C